uniref:OSJNBb0014D23.5 protein n=1 Tax=Oryza sativa subsp. japonica TaxID=39947 RepID=Q7XL84_ORYSJ|nr:OSJNBb0014D23.5 [Oryza sativa Japonica Group]
MAASSSKKKEEEEVAVVAARKGRLRQRYDGEYRLVAGCVPYRVVAAGGGGGGGELEVLMVSTPNRADLVFPKGGWEDDEDVYEAACREAMEEAGVKGNINVMSLYRNNVTTITITDIRAGCNLLLSYTSVSVMLIKIFKLKQIQLILSSPKDKEIFDYKFEYCEYISIYRVSLGMWVMRSKSSQSGGGGEASRSPRGGACKGYMFELEVTEEMDRWPEQATHGRRWLPPADAFRLSRYGWMREALAALLDRRCLLLLPPPQPEPSEHAGVYGLAMLKAAAAAAADRAVALC